MEITVYLRFISPWPSEMRNVNYGLFQAIYYSRDTGLLPSYLRENVLSELAWFKRYLPSPDEHNFTFSGHQIGICWFHSHAKIMIEHARTVSALLAEADVWITVVRTRNPGKILYSDEY